jgi:AcrR family transcriptional regulator
MLPATAPSGTVSPGRPVRRRLGRPVASSGDERRRLIIAAARRQFARAGFLGTTNRAIADEAGITTGAIYHYFPSKLDVYLAVFEETDALILARYRQVASDLDLGFEELVAGILEVSSQLNSEDQSLAAFLASASFEASRDPQLLLSYRKHDRKMVRFFGQMVDRGIAEGVVLPGEGRQAALDAVRVLTLGLTLFSVRVKDPDVHRRATNATVRALRGELLGAPLTMRRQSAAH